jgi:tRNA A-37 threonylcarbamoyl transferase component Bud32
MDTVGEFVRAVEGPEHRLPCSPNQRSLHSFGGRRKSVNVINCFRSHDFGSHSANDTCPGQMLDATERCRAPGKQMGLADSYAMLWQDGGPLPDVFAFLESHAVASARERADVLLIDQGNRWRAGLRLPAECYLRQFPDVAADPELRLDLVYGEIYCAFENGEKAPLTQLGERFPDLRDELIRQYEVAEWVLARAGGDECESFLGTDFGLSRGLSGAPAATAPDVSSLEHSGRFSIRRWIGEGGMGVVYEAFDHKRGERVALKTLHLADSAALYRFKREFRALVGVRHPNLVTLHELFSSRGRWFFTMELVDGIDFLTYVRGEWSAAGRERPGSRSRLTRVREAMRQLAEGVETLHSTGWLHRDIKPTNVLVTREGRVVLLDFGLAARLMGSGEHMSTEHHILGTFSYMAPEQAAGRTVSRASDWYSVGTMLFEGLTDRLPFEGHPLEMIEGKNRGPVAPSKLEAGVPPELDALCLDLLRPEPARRATGREVLSRLASTARARPVPEAPSGASLIGRSRHLRELDGAFEIVRSGRPAVVFVRGRSGAGKSALVQHFLDGLASRGAAVALAGRCYEQESVPFKAIDSVIDALSRHLRRLTRLEVQGVLPRDLGPLLRMFPVLRRVDAVAAAAAAGRQAAGATEPPEVRRRAFAALRELLSRLGDRRSLVVSIDDFQWGDSDSAALLAELLLPPDPPVLLLIASFRSEDEVTSPILQQFLRTPCEDGAVPQRKVLDVEDLSRGDAHKLARALLGSCEATVAARAEEIACESGGNPFFICELVQSLATGSGRALGDAHLGQVRLGEVLWSRVLELPDDARRLIEVVAAYGQPLTRENACRAAGLAPADHAAVDALKNGRLVRGASPTGRDLIETYHDRVRETVVAHITAERMAEIYAALAETLESSGAADPEALAVLFHGAGRTETALAFYARAADQAAEALAYDRAITLYRKALALWPQGGPSACGLRARLANVLADAGRGALAAREYLLAAMESEVIESFELERRAAMHLLISGHVDEGLAVLRVVLAAKGLSLPRNRYRAHAALLLRRFLIRLRGTGIRPRASASANRPALSRIDVCLAAASGLSGFDPIRGAYFQAYGLLLALRAGEPCRTARALAMVAEHEAGAGRRSLARTELLLRTAGALAHRAGRPELIGLVTATQGVAAFMQGRFRDSVTFCDRAEGIFREECTGVSWELDTAQIYALWSRIYLGELAELRRRWGILLTAAGERGDLFAIANLSTRVLAIMRLVEDEPDLASAELTRVMGQWSRRGYFVQQHHALLARTMIELYRGEAEKAWQLITEYDSTYRASFLVRCQQMRIELLQLRARAALAVSAACGGRSDLLRAAARDARRLERERMPWSDALAWLIRAGIAGARGDLAGSVPLLEGAVKRFVAADMELFAVAARRQLGRLLSDGRGARLITEADLWLACEGVRDANRFCGMTVPGFPV